MKTDNETELKQLQMDCACPNGKTYRHSDVTLLVGRTNCTQCDAYCGEERGFVYCDKSKLVETDTLKSSEGLVEEVVSIIKTFTLIEDGDKKNPYGIIPPQYNDIAIAIVKAITPTPETASEGEK